MCVVGRFLIGTTDSMTIFQQTIMCIWFPASQLPFAFGILLFLVKIVRTTNDNVATLFYESMGSDSDGEQINVAGLVAYFWVGFAICIYSTLSSLILGQIHESVIDNSSNSEVREKKKELKKIKNEPS